MIFTFQNANYRVVNIPNFKSLGQKSRHLMIILFTTTLIWDTLYHTKYKICCLQSDQILSETTWFCLILLLQVLLSTQICKSRKWKKIIPCKIFEKVFQSNFANEYRIQSEYQWVGGDSNFNWRQNIWSCYNRVCHC